MNLNKIFPRLSIRAKLAIGFAAVAGVPLVVVGTLGGLSALGELTDAAEVDLRHDLELVQERATSSLQQVRQHVEFLRDLGFVAPDGGRPSEAVLEVGRRYLVSDPSALFRVVTLDREGRITAVAERPDVRTERVVGSVQPLYHYRALDLAPGTFGLWPVELEAASSGLDTLVMVPAVAVILPVFTDGEYVGSVVGEASAEVLFDALDLASPALSGTTGLSSVDEGFLLYHTERKASWEALLTEARLEDHVGSELAGSIQSGATEGLVRVPGRGVVIFRTIELGAAAPLLLYRVVPVQGLVAPVQRFMLVYSGGGLVLLLIVLAVSVVAAEQITRPIYRLRRAARTLAEGEPLEEMKVETNDELEDLSRDFLVMAGKLEEHRDHLESLVWSRTQALRETQEELRQIVTMSADAIVGLDANQHVRLWNRGASDIFGYSAEEAIGRSLSALIGPAPGERQKEVDFFAQALAKRGSVSNYRTVRHDREGTEIPTTITTTALHAENGETVGYSVVLRDDRGREKLEEQMRKSDRLSAISVMAAGLAHELNNPLSVLGNRIELMEREAKSKGYDEHLLRDLEVLGKHVQRISSVTGDLLRFARDESDTLVAVEPNPVIERVGRLMRRVFVSADLDLTFDLDPDLPAVLGNESVIETALVNLLLNAQQATPGGGKVEVITRRDPTDEEIEVEVRDSGPGIPYDLRVRIFEPFFTTKGERGGTGLGLAVCRTLIDRCGGRIWINESHEGASFVMSFPQQANGRP